MKLCLKMKKVLLEITVKTLSSAEAKKIMCDELGADLLKVNKCPDFVEDKGHYFGTELPDADKRALIEFLKTI